MEQNDTTRQRPGEPFEVRAIVERYENRPDELTLYPEDIPMGDRVRTWITATSGSFVDAREMR